MKLLFVARAIHQMAGGVERMITTIMNAMVEHGHQVDFLTWDLAGAVSFYPLAPDIAWYPLNMGDPAVKATRRLKMRRTLTVRRLMRQIQPDVIVCFQAGTFIAMRTYTAGMSIPVIAAERNAPSRFQFIQAGRYQSLTYQALRWAEVILVQCESYRSLYPAFLRDRIVTIPNPVLPAQSFAQPAQPNPTGRFQMVSVGRLSYQKNYSVLIEAFATLADQFPNWDLVIWGEGEERSKLTQLIQERALEQRISLPGVTTAISEAYINAHLFCLPSLWEGFPNALGEALAHGLPSIGFVECAGMSDLITPDKNGLLADGNNDSTTLARAMAHLIESDALRVLMGQIAIRSMQAYEPEQIFTQWQSVLRSVAQP